ncbi:MAG: Holliday junction resolvase RuvX [Flavobacteriales bacterium]|nr:Holliday junction resolvase RuvX [Flavobacteriales bacterium]
MSVALGIDYGSKRVGLAITDSLGMIASPLKVIHSSEITDWLKKNIPQLKIKTLVVGEPKRLNGTETDASKMINEFCVHLKRTFPELELVRVDERFTSSMAAQAMALGGASKKKKEDKSTLDAVSAAIILQSWLDAKR